ncbi:MAG: CDP-alcohol phosphatidyltransferase family protein [Candidatus Poribacteria bacterium]|nr:CDP-alcohol phosphatidyltransferase family protein [Candidatus Poribacteria bacterium]
MMAAFESFARRVLNRGAVPVARALSAIGIPANVITIVGFLGNVAAAVLIFQGKLVYGGIAMLIAGLFDVLDGAVARASNKTDQSGALLDSVVDRYSEAIIFFALWAYFFVNSQFVAASFTFLSIIGSLLVSYIRARAEGLDIECRVGLMQRGERIGLLSIGLMLSKVQFASFQSPNWAGSPLLIIVLGALAVLSNLTALRRLIFSYSELHRVGRG